MSAGLAFGRLRQRNLRTLGAWGQQARKIAGELIGAEACVGLLFPKQVRVIAYQAIEQVLDQCKVLED